MPKITLENIMNTLLDFRKETSERLNSLESTQNVLLDFKEETSKRLTSLENILTRIEVEHGKKSDALCEYINVNSSKHRQYDKSIIKINSKLFDHNNRIESLEEKLS